MIGKTVRVYDIKSGCYREAIVINRYGSYSDFLECVYPDCIDIKFLYDGRISKGHFVSFIEVLGEKGWENTPVNFETSISYKELGLPTKEEDVWSYWMKED